MAEITAFKWPGHGCRRLEDLVFFPGLHFCLLLLLFPSVVIVFLVVVVVSLTGRLSGAGRSRFISEKSRFLQFLFLFFFVVVFCCCFLSELIGSAGGRQGPDPACGPWMAWRWAIHRPNAAEGDAETARYCRSELQKTAEEGAHRRRCRAELRAGALERRAAWSGSECGLRRARMRRRGGEGGRRLR